MVDHLGPSFDSLGLGHHNSYSVDACNLLVGPASASVACVLLAAAVAGTCSSSDSSEPFVGSGFALALAVSPAGLLQRVVGTFVVVAAVVGALQHVLVT